MSIIQKIKEAQLQARKERKTEQVGTLTTLIGEINYVAKGKGLSESSDSDAIKVIQKFADNIEVVRQGYAKQDNIQAFQKAQALQAEKELVESFLPPPLEQLTEEQIRKVITDYVGSSVVNLTMKDVMAYLKVNYAGQYDGKVANQLVKVVLT